MKIGTKILLVFLLAITLSFGTIEIMISNKLDEHTREYAFDIAVENASRQSLEIQNEFNQAIAISRTLAYSLGQLSEWKLTERDFVDSIFRNILHENNAYTAVWTVWEPDAFDGKDAAFVNHPASDSSGRLLTSWLRNEDSVWVEADRYYDTAGYYQIPKKEGRILFSNPFLYNDIYVVNAIAPVYVHNKFSGVVGIDLSLEYIYHQLHGRKIFGDGSNFVIAANGAIAMDSESELRTGSIFQPFLEDTLIRDAVLTGKSLSLQNPGNENEPETLDIYNPIHIKGADINWSLLVRTPLEAILAPSRAVRNQLIIVGLAGSISILLLLFLVIKFFGRPVGNMSRNLRLLTRGQTSGFRGVDTSRKDEIGEMNRSFLHLVETVEQKKQTEDALLKAKEETDRKNKTISELNKDLEKRVRQRTLSLHAEIEERGRAEARLRMSQGILNIAQALAKTGSWQISIKNQRIQCSDEWCRIHNQKKTSLARGLDYLAPDRILPEDRRLFIQQLNNLLNRKINASEGQYRLIVNKQIHWISWAAQITEDTETSQLYITGATQDISLRKQYEEHLEDYRLIINASGEYMALVDMDFSFHAISNSLATKLKRRKEEVLGTQISDIFDNAANAELVQSLLRRVKKEGSLREQHWLSFSASARPAFMDVKMINVVSESRDIERIVISMNDITELKNTEQQLKIFKRLVDASGLGFGMCSLDARLSYQNPSLQEMCGRKALEDGLGEDILKLYDDDAATFIREEIWPKLLKGGQWMGEMDIIGALGARIPTLQNFFVINDYDERPAYIGFVLTNISKRKAIQDQLEYQARILQNVTDAIISTDEEYKILTMNASAEKLMGWKLEECKGNDLRMFWHRKESPGIPPEIRHKLNESGNWLGETLLFKRDGTSLVSLSSLSMLADERGDHNGMVMVINDLTHQKEAEEARMRSERNFAAIFHHAAIGMDVLDENGNFREFNNTFLHMLGYPQEELKNLNVSEVSHPEDRQRNADWLYQLFRGNISSYRFEKRYIRKDGSWFWADLSVSSFFGPNDEKLAIGTIIDITDAKNLQQKLEYAMKEAREANRSKSEFLANMSHEIRTPLNSVIGFTDLLESLIEDPKKKSYLDSIKTGGKNLLMLINDILDLSKIEAGRMELQPEAVSVKSLMEEVRQIFSLRIEEKQLDFILEYDDDMPQRLILDEIRLRQVIFNLVGNAIKFTHRGFVRLKLLKTFEYPGKKAIDMSILVEDSGIGIARDQQKLIFEAFRQQAGQSNRKYGGTGLGLAISKRLVEMMDGQISLSSELGKGSVFKVSFKNVKISDGLHMKNDEVADIDLTALRFDGQSVLVVDDIDLNRKFLTESLSAKGLNTLEASNGREALQQMRIHKPDLILMDLRMPVMDGYEATQIIRENADWKDIPIIAITASVMSTEREKVSEGMFHAMLFKPIPSEQLFARIMDYIPAAKVPEKQAKKEIEPDSRVWQFSTDIRKLLSQHRQQLWQLYKTAVEQELSDDLEAFSQALNAFAAETHHPDFMRYSSQLNEQIINFDLDKLSTSLRMFPQEWEKLEKCRPENEA